MNRFVEYQLATSKFAKYEEGIEKFLDLPRSEQARILRVIYCLLGAAGEFGETLNKVKKVLRGDLSFEAAEAGIMDESGDALWYQSELHNVLGHLLSDTAEANIEKLEGRKARDTLQGSGDNR